MQYYVVRDRYGPLTVLNEKEEARRMTKANSQRDFYEVGWLRAKLVRRRIDSTKRDAHDAAESYNRGR